MTVGSKSPFNQTSKANAYPGSFCFNDNSSNNLGGQKSSPSKQPKSPLNNNNTNGPVNGRSESFGNHTQFSSFRVTQGSHNPQNSISNCPDSNIIPQSTTNSTSPYNYRLE